MRIIEPDFINNPLTLNGTHEFSVIFEIGDIFIDANRNVRCIVDIFKSFVSLCDEKRERYIEHIPFSEDFFKRFRYAGTVNDDSILIYEDALCFYDANIIRTECVDKKKEYISANCVENLKVNREKTSNEVYCFEMENKNSSEITVTVFGNFKNKNYETKNKK